MKIINSTFTFFIILSILILGTISNEDVLQNVYGLVVIDFESFTVGDFLTTQLLTQGVIFDNIEVHFVNHPCWASGTLGNHILVSFETKTLDFVNNADPVFFGTTDFFEVTILDIDRANPVSIRAYDVNENLLEEKFAIPNPTGSVGLCVQTLTISQSGIARIELDAKEGGNGFDNIEFNDVVPTNTLRSITQSSTTQALGQTTILGTCGLSFPDGNSVDYGSLLPNTISSETALNMTNSGSVPALLEIRGTDWEDTSNNSVMNVNQTHFNQTAFQNTFASKAVLNATDGTVTNSFVPSELVQLLLQLEAVLLDPFFTGSATQTMDFTVSC